MKVQYRIRKGTLGNILKFAVSHYVRILSARRAPYLWLFILSHMRSGSSLLAHILFSNPEIAGYGETQISYRSDSDFDLLLAKIAYYERTLPKIPDTWYLMDKLLHNHCLGVNELSLLENRNAKVVFLLRDANETVSSLMTALGMDEHAAIEYLTTRLETLTQCAAAMPLTVPMFSLTYDHLTSETDTTLTALSDFLTLETPLSPSYQTHRLTGRAGIGDISANIHAGHILSTAERMSGSTRKRQDYGTVEDEFRSCWEEISRLSRSPVPKYDDFINNERAPGQE